MDEEGRHATFHALRATLATNLARANVPPAVTMRLMRHSNMRVTLRPYTALTSTDTRAALAALPRLGATGATSPAAQAPRKRGPDRKRRQA